MNDREACIVLNMISGIGSARMQALLNRFETPANIFEQPSAGIAGVKGIGQELAEKIAGWRNEIDLNGELEMADKGGAKIITVVDSEYPAILKEIYDPPICLYVRGTLPDFSANTLAVVGSRRMTAYVPAIVEMLAAIALDPTHKDAARVGLGILDRTGHGPTKTVNTNIVGDIQQTTTHKIDVTDPRTAVAVRKFADALNLNSDDFAKYLGTELAKRAGLPAAPALPTSDAEFEEVEEFEFKAS